jgi:hypothetical protein
MDVLGQNTAWPEFVRTRFKEHIRQIQEEASEERAVVTSFAAEKNFAACIFPGLNTTLKWGLCPSWKKMAVAIPV